MRDDRIVELYEQLLDKYGHPSDAWSLWCKRPKTIEEKEEIVIGAILTQRTSWKNVEIAFKNLKDKKLCSLKAIARNPKKIPSLIRPAGFYKQKSRYLLGAARFIVNSGGIKELLRKEPLELREKLLNLHGVGPETADSIILYALEKPVFVIDEYTRRLVKVKGISEEKNYEKLRHLFEASLKKDWRLYQDFHSLIVREGKSGK